MKVLVAEDDINILRGLTEILEKEGYRVVGTRNGTDVSHLKEVEKPDFICLDIMMPGKSGYDVCREIREKDPDIPIIFISAKTEEIDKVVGLELGADDYISKPFGVREVVARIRAITRRCLRRPRAGGHLDSEPFVMKDLEVTPAELRARRGGESIDLSLREVLLLQILHRSAGKALDRHTLFTHGWQTDHVPNSRTLDQHIAQLRKHIEKDPQNPEIIQTVHGVGYRYEES